MTYFSNIHQTGSLAKIKGWKTTILTIDNYIGVGVMEFEFKKNRIIF